MRATVPSLPERLRERIAREGPISFYDFMQAALYDPVDGYYARGAAIGEGGDFLTSPHVSPAFAAALARLFAVDADGVEGPVDFVEVGAGDGRFLRGLRLRRCGGWIRRFFARLRLTAVEASAAGPPRARRPGHRARAAHPRERRGARGRSRSRDGSSRTSSTTRCRSRASWVRPTGFGSCASAPEGSRFVWSTAPASDGAAGRTWRALGVVLEPGQKAEIAPDAAPLHRTPRPRARPGIARGLRLRAPGAHPLSPVRAAARERSRSTWADGAAAIRSRTPGERDLTAHVNWDALLAAGEAEGLRAERLMRQGLFLTEAGIFDFAGSDAEKWRIFRLVDPEGMGEELSVLVQSRMRRIGVLERRRKRRDKGFCFACRVR